MRICRPFSLTTVPVIRITESIFHLCRPVKPAISCRDSI